MDVPSDNSSRIHQSGSTVTIERVTLSIAGQTIAVYVTKTGEQDSINYLFTDHLGSSSVVTDQNSNYNPATDRAQYLPFGGLRASTPDFLRDITDNHQRRLHRPQRKLLH